jgi:hypothetical protein
MPATTSGGAPDRSRPWAASTGWAARLLMTGESGASPLVRPGPATPGGDKPGFSALD